MTTGERIHARRKLMKMTLEEVGDKLGVTKACIYKYEHDLVNIPTGVIDNLAEVLECSPAYLMGWESEIDRNKTSREKLEGALKNIDRLSSERAADCYNLLHCVYPELFVDT